MLLNTSYEVCWEYGDPAPDTRGDTWKAASMAGKMGLWATEGRAPSIGKDQNEAEASGSRRGADSAQGGVRRDC